MLKKIDSLLIKSFLPPFVLTFFIAVFVLIMQFLWQYVDDIIGKGLGGWVIMELLLYRSAALIPMALPIATLISSVMVMGNLGERYELAAMKSAGISLTRIMRPLILAAFVISIGSFWSANWLIPVANLQFKSRLYDIRRQKPMLTISEGTFMNDLTGYILRIGKKEKDERSISDILIYDHQLNRNNTKMIMAKTGTMGYSADKRFLVMELKDGSRYEELQGRTTKTNAYPFTRTNFKSYETVFDMKQFELDKTDQDAFKTHQSMLNIKQLSAAIDSIDMNIKRRKKGFDEYILPYFYFRIPIKPPHLFTHQKPPARASFLAIFPKEERGNIANRAVNSARNIYDYARVTQEDLRLVGVNRNEHFNEWHRKFSLAISCLMFLFIGAPMGAIIRKGGFGWPILISILFFVVFIILSMTGEKLAKDFTLAPFFGMWLANFILFPFGMFLTYKAMRESQLIDLDGIMAFIKRIGLFFTKKKTTK